MALLERRGLEVKTCTRCGIEKSLSMFYSQNKYSKKRGNYTYYQPYCKECAIKATEESQMKDYDNYLRKSREKQRRRNSTEESKLYNKKHTEKRRSEGYFKRYQIENKDKFAQYRINREQNKTHEITDGEWSSCLIYFSHSCAYCGISEQQAVKEYDQRLHKEHVDHEGENGLSNNIPACKSCNSKKWTFPFEDWYNSENEVFDTDRYLRIVNWIGGDFEKYLDGTQ